MVIVCNSVGLLQALVALAACHLPRCMFPVSGMAVLIVHERWLCGGSVPCAGLCLLRAAAKGWGRKCCALQIIDRIHVGIGLSKFPDGAAAHPAHIHVEREACLAGLPVRAKCVVVPSVSTAVPAG